MKNWIFSSILLGGWIASFSFCIFLSFENTKIRNEAIYNAQQVENPTLLANYKKKSTDWEIFDLNDVNYFRNQGKVDGKIEALLMMNKQDTVLEKDQIVKIIEIAEKSSAEALSQNPQFLSLLCQAAYHKGIDSGYESAKEEFGEEYDKGYHKAIEDFSCPETGNMSVPKNKLDLTKPSK